MKAEAALQAAHDELERRVEQRTAELATAIEEMRLEIAERERAEEALGDSWERLKLFAYSVIHDLKSPVIGVHGFANLPNTRYRDLLDDKGKKGSEGAEIVPTFTYQRKPSKNFSPAEWVVNTSSMRLRKVGAQSLQEQRCAGTPGMAGRDDHSPKPSIIADTST